MTRRTLRVVLPGRRKPRSAWKNIPDFIQPMARKEIERLAQERGATSVSAELMDEAKEKFMKFM